MGRITSFFKLIRFEHSVFALPFAYLGLFIAENGWPRLTVFLWVTVAMVCIRTSAMSLNRLIDEPLDALNSRTKYRIDLIGQVSKPVVWLMIILSIFIFVLSCWFLNPLCLMLSPIPVILIWVYPYLKKFTWCSHFVLGMILAIAPTGGWLSATGKWSWQPILLSGAVWAWVSGFDLIYALQDMENDRRQNLFSFPARFGFEKTINFSAWLHGLMIVFLIVFGWVNGRKILYGCSIFLVGILILREHYLVRRYKIEKINEAFFDVNAWVGVIIFAATLMELV